MKHKIYLKLILISTIILKPVLIRNFNPLESKGRFSSPYYEVELHSYIRILSIYFLILIPFILFFSIVIKKTKKLEIIGAILNILIIFLIIISIVIRWRNNL